jgi:RNA polymerase sigma-70 factor, ECF subfamily
MHDMDHQAAPLGFHTAPEATLIAAIAAGDSTAVRRLYGLTHVRLYRYLMRYLRNEAIAEEVMNEVYLAVWQNAARYEARSTPMTWMLSIAHNKAISTLRKRRETTGVDQEASEQIEDDSDTPEIITQKLDKAQLIRACIDRLTPDHRGVLDLVYYQERSVAEAAEILAIPEATVKTRMFYARKKLSELLLAAGVDRGWP